MQKAEDISELNRVRYAGVGHQLLKHHLDWGAFLAVPGRRLSETA
jgi:hypothetical protein